MEPRGHWLRVYEDMGDDPKFRVIAKRAAASVPGVRASDALAVWTQLLCRASAASPRGSVEGYDCETADASLDLPDGAACAIMAAFEAKGMISAGVITSWAKSQPQREGGENWHRALGVFSLAWARMRKRIFERDNFTCVYCGKRGGRLECDHIMPVSRGGLTEDANLVTSCIGCNRSKGAKTLEEWRP